MHRSFIAFAGALALGAALVSAQGQEKTYRGCLIPSTGDSFLLIKAVEKGDKSKTKVNITVVPATEKVNVGQRVNNEVEVTGTVTPGKSEGEPATLSATKISWKADYCG
jgi:hypothetical protein